MVRASRQCDPDLVVNGNLIAVLNDHILLQLFCDVAAEAGANAWVGEYTQAMPTPLHAGHAHAARDFASHHIHCIRVNP